MEILDPAAGTRLVGLVGRNIATVLIPLGLPLLGLGGPGRDLAIWRIRDEPQAALVGVEVLVPVRGTAPVGITSPAVSMNRSRSSRLFTFFVPRLDSHTPRRFELPLAAFRAFAASHCRFVPVARGETRRIRESVPRYSMPSDAPAYNQ